MRDDPGAPCPSCGAAATRQFFPAGIVFKGSGFYKTDSRGASSSSITSDSGESKSGAAAAKSDGQKSDGAKSDAKSEKKTPVSEGSTTTTKTASTDAAS
jgi:predicted nucleic acid-binding Zn ribbon protein